jgi:hypothetical protein
MPLGLPPLFVNPELLLDLRELLKLFFHKAKS